MPDVLIFSSILWKSKEDRYFNSSKARTEILCVKKSIQKKLLIIRYMLKLSFLEWVIK